MERAENKSNSRVRPDSLEFSHGVRGAENRQPLRVPETSLVNDGIVTVVDRASLDKVRQELNFNLSGEVSDQSAQSIGKMLGAQAIVTGNLSIIGDLRRVMFKVIITETAAVAVQYPADIVNDNRVKALLAQGGGSQSVTYSGQGSTSGKQAAAVLKNGTYTFTQSIQCTAAGIPKDGYITRVIVSGGFVSFYIAPHPREAQGNWNSGAAHAFYWYNTPPYLKDIDSNKTFNALKAETYPNGAVLIFEKVTGSRFMLSTSDYNPPFIFEEIILGEPDK